MKKYCPSIQVFRGLLFLLILAFHSEVPYANIFGVGGVETFFVISSFFLVKKFWGTDNLNIKKQFMHRTTRLYPPYIIVLVVALLYTVYAEAIPYDFFSHLLSAQNFQWMITDYSSAMQPMTAHTWTLSIEVWNGLFWLILLKFLSKDKFRLSMYGMIITGVFYRVITIYSGCDVWIISLCPVAHFDAFAVGSLLAIKAKENELTKKVGLWSLLGFIGIAACIIDIAKNNQIGVVQAYFLFSSSKYYLCNWLTGNIYLFVSIFSAGIVGLLFLHDDHREVSDTKVMKLLTILGDNSYTLYLFHWPIFVVVRHLWAEWFIVFPVVFVMSMAASLIFKMCVRQFKKYFGRN